MSGKKGATSIRDPIIIVAAPRSGSSLLLAALSAHPDLWSLYKESNQILEGPFHPELRGADSHALSEDDLDVMTREQILEDFFKSAGNLERLPLARHVPLRGRGRPWYSTTISMVSLPFKRPPIRLVEKSPRNTLRIPFIRKLFADARFIHLTRDARANIASLYGGWQDPLHYNVRPLPEGFRLNGYDGSHWCFVLQPDWRSLDGSSLVDACADQWRACNEHCLRDLREMPAERVFRLKFEDLVRSPATSLAEIATWADLDAKPFARFSDGLPVVQRSTSPTGMIRDTLPGEIEAILPHLAALRTQMGYADPFTRSDAPDTRNGAGAEG